MTLALILGQEVARALDHVQRLGHRKGRLHRPAGRVERQDGIGIGPEQQDRAGVLRQRLDGGATLGGARVIRTLRDQRRQPASAALVVDGRERRLVRRDDLR